MFPSETSGAVEGPPDDPIRPSPQSRVHWIFFGPEGLRPGWGLLLFVALVAAMVAGISQIAAREAPTPGPHLVQPKALFMNEGLLLAIVSIATWVMAKIERRPVGVFGLGGKRRLANFLMGLAWGAGFLSLLVFTLRGAGLLVFDGRRLFGASAFHFAAVWGACYLMVGLFEEYVFRGYLLFTLSRGLAAMFVRLGPRRSQAWGFWTAAVLLSFGFGLVHKSNAGESPIGLLSAGLIALVFCFSLWRTGSLWWAIGVHAAWDWAQSFMYGVADSGTMIRGHLLATHPAGRTILSGGLTGPEGSVFVLPVIAMFAIVIALTLPRADSPYRPVAEPQPSLD